MIFSSPEALQDYAAELAKTHTKILLHGELWAGKTTFVKGYVHSFGIDPETVTSPTYTYINIYRDKILHIDMYRIKSVEHAHGLGILDLIDTYEIVLIERPKWEEEYVDEHWSSVLIEKISDTERSITLQHNFLSK